MNHLKPAVLIVEDDPAQLADCEAKFEAMGFVVATAATAEDGIALVERRQFDLILTDNVLPGMTGLASIHKLISRSAAPIFLMTSHPSSQMEEDAMLLGARACFSKPLDFSRLRVYFESEMARARSPLRLSEDP